MALMKEMEVSRLEEYNIQWQAKQKAMERLRSHSTGSIMLTGPTGCGKTKLAELLLAKLKVKASMIDMSQFESPEDFESELKTLCNTERDIHNHKTGIIIKGFEMAKIQTIASIERAIHKKNKNIFLVCNNKHGNSGITKMASNNFTIRMGKLSMRDATHIIDKTCSAINNHQRVHTITSREAISISETSLGDIRQCFYLTRLAMMGMQAKGQADRRTSPFDTAECMFDIGIGIEERIDRISTSNDSRLAGLLIHENYPTRLKYKTIACDTTEHSRVACLNELWQCIDHISLADTFDSLDFSNQEAFRMRHVAECITALAPMSKSDPSCNVHINMTDRESMRFPAKAYRIVKKPSKILDRNRHNPMFTKLMLPTIKYTPQQIDPKLMERRAEYIRNNSVAMADSFFPACLFE